MPQYDRLHRVTKAGEGEAHAGASPPVRPRVRGNVALLRAGQPAHDVQPETKAPETTAVPRLALDEALEDALAIAGGDPDPVVLHHHHDGVAVDARADRDHAAFR